MHPGCRGVRADGQPHSAQDGGGIGRAGKRCADRTADSADLGKIGASAAVAACQARIRFHRADGAVLRCFNRGQSGHSVHQPSHGGRLHPESGGFRASGWVSRRGSVAPCGQPRGAAVQHGADMVSHGCGKPFGGAVARYGVPPGTGAVGRKRLPHDFGRVDEAGERRHQPH